MELWFSEFHAPDVKHSIRVNRHLYSHKSDYQQIDIFDTPEFGRVLALDGNVMLTEGLVLQDEKIWTNFLGREIIPNSNSCELYFEENDIEAFAAKLEKLYPSIQYVNRLMTHSWGQKVLRFYDPDGNLIEVGTPQR